MNKKGFAISGLVYSILILFLLLIFSILSILESRKMILDKLKNDSILDFNSDESLRWGNLINTLLEKSTNGLMQDENNKNVYFYSGEDDFKDNKNSINNFLWYEGFQWRVIEFDTNKRTLKLISQQPLTTIAIANNPWKNIDEYNETYINNWLTTYFYENLSPKLKKNIRLDYFNIGKQKSDTNEENFELKLVGLLNGDDYNRAGGANSYLNISDWQFFSNIRDKNYVMSSTQLGLLFFEPPSKSMGIRPVITINDIEISNGNGTLKDNYRNVTFKNSNDKINVGDYIKIPSKSIKYCGNDKCLFRVVSNKNNKLKLILNGTLPNKVNYGENAIITSKHSIYNDVNNDSLNSFLADLNVSKYITTGEFFIGEYGNKNSENYLNTQNKLLKNESNADLSIGLPTIGEFFSGNDLDIGGNDKFVDSDLIENKKIGNSYWTMNSYDENNVNVINSDGSISKSDHSSKEFIRPVIYINNNFKIVSGDGSPYSAYEFE